MYFEEENQNKYFCFTICSNHFLLEIGDEFRGPWPCGWGLTTKNRFLESNLQIFCAEGTENFEKSSL